MHIIFLQVFTVPVSVCKPNSL